jgi:CBS-domain-containing membrane protein
VQARDVMTRQVVTVGPETSAKYAAEVMAERGFAALPVVDDADRLVGIVAEADVLRDRLPQNRLRGHRVFPGRLDESRLSFGERAMVTAMRAPVGDFRDWGAVAAWADEIAEDIAAAR